MEKLRFVVDADAPKQSFGHYWEMCVGSCHGYTALRADYREQLIKAKKDLGFRYVRFHGILDDDMCVVQKDRSGEIRYNFFNIDNIIDFLLSIDMKPFMELGFMPTPLASGTETVFHYKGNITLPADFEQWDAFIAELIRHLIGRYGIAEVSQWFFEVWNEPNLKFFFAGDLEDYLRLYEHTARAIKSVDERLQVGGPATALNAWIPELITYCREKNAPLDFISSHHYPTDENLWKSGMTLEEFFGRLFAEGKEPPNTYHRGILTEMIKKAREEAEGYPLYYTEWNTSSILGDDIHDYPYSSALVVKTVLDNAGYVDAYSYWTFTDIFEEPPQTIGEFHHGFGLQTVHGIPKPVYRAFELLHHLGSERYPLMEEQSTVGMVATTDDQHGSGVHVLAYNQQVRTEEVKEETVELVLRNKKATAAVIIRVDEEHANPRKIWEEMGEPVYPDKVQMDQLYQASLIKEEILPVIQEENGCRVEFVLPPQGIALVKLV